jgi:hypothetical protein
MMHQKEWLYFIFKVISDSANGDQVINHGIENHVGQEIRHTHTPIERHFRQHSGLIEHSSTSLSIH